MLVVETIGKIRRYHFVEGLPVVARSNFLMPPNVYQAYIAPRVYLNRSWDDPLSVRHYVCLSSFKEFVRQARYTSGVMALRAV